MGLFQVKIKIASVADPVPSFHEEVKAWVDTGAVYTLIPAPLLERCGVIQRTPPKVLLSAEGKSFKRTWGSAYVMIQGVMTTIDVLFGKKEDPPLLGCVALEQTGFAVDPVRQRLIPQKMIQQYVFWHCYFQGDEAPHPNPLPKRERETKKGKIASS